MPHSFAADVVIRTVFAADHEACFVRQCDHAGGRQILVFMGAVAIDINERREPVTGRQRARTPRIPGKANYTLSELVGTKLGTIGARCL